MATVVAAPAATLPVAYRFSNVFGLNQPQSNLDFVDVLVDTDTPLFIDPFALKITSGDWAAECNNLVVGFFQELIEAMKAGNLHHARELLTNLHEPNETRLGLSQGRPRGRGVGTRQASSLYNAFANSKAVRTGILTDLSDCELFIDGIGHDKISDITVNIIRRKLVEFTQEQCRKWDVPMQIRPIGPYWDAEDLEWHTCYSELPVHDGMPIILAPKRAARYKLALDDREYYNFHVVEFIQQEFCRQENVDSKVALTRMLRAGKRERRVSKKTIKEKHPLSKDFLREFSEKHPEILEEYKRIATAALQRGKHCPTDLGIYELERKTAHFQSMILIEEVHMHNNEVRGDNFGVVGQGNVTIRDINVYKSEVDKTAGFDDQTKELLKRAVDTIEEAEIDPGEKQDAKDNLQKLTDELKNDKRPGVVGRYLNRIAEVMPSAASILSSCVAIADLVGKATS